MTTHQSFGQQDLDDLIFEHRNKQYGAYRLRKQYDDRLITAFSTAIGLVILLIVSFALRGHPPVPADTIPAVTDSIGIIHIETFQLQHPHSTTGVTHPDARITPVITSHAVDSVQKLPQQPLESTGTGNTGQPAGGVSNGNGTIPSSPDTAIQKVITIPDDYKPYYEVAPEFPGGFKAMENFILDHYEVPQQALDYHAGGKIFVELKINTDGSIADAKVVKGIGFGCDEEALRVIRLMPRWKPAQSGHHAVRVRVTIPVVVQIY